MSTANESTVNEEVLALRKSGGYFLLADYTVISISGADAAKFLQTRLSNDVFALSIGAGQWTALLDRKAHVLAYFSLHRLHTDEFWCLLEANQADRVLAELETYHFREQVSFKQLQAQTLLCVQSPRYKAFLSGLTNKQTVEPLLLKALSIAQLTISNHAAIAINISFTGEQGFVFIFANRAETEPLLAENCQALHMVPLSPPAQNIARIEAGLLKYGIDFNEEQLLPETGLENVAASYAKGCFQGQEVLARIRTYGAPRRGVIGLIFSDSGVEPYMPGSICTIDGLEAGQLKSNCYSPCLQRVIALAFVNREYRVPDKELLLSIDSTNQLATATVPPFVHDEQKRQRAKAIYDEALQEFANGSEIKAAEQLRSAIELDTSFADAYETLGVILSRQNELDEAIILMKELERLDPESIMAHSNLSVFYMQKGDKEAAEEEKAKAMSIRMNQLTKEMLNERQLEQEKQKRKEQAGERMEMFRQVLAIDKDDFLANAGMGSAHVDLEEYAEALPYLQRALDSRPNHTVAYVSLGQCYEHLGDPVQAIAVYQKGLAVAAQKGEMTPLKDLQARLAKLGGEQVR